MPKAITVLTTCLAFFVLATTHSRAQQRVASDTAPAHPDVSPLGDRFFVEQIYPIMRTVQCNLCHNDNGVASETELRFPESTATEEQIAAFGFKLMEFVDRDEPAESLLLLKPTNREEHTGGERIVPGSPEEQLLARWVQYLADLNAEQRELAREKIARAERFRLEPLTVRRLTHSQYNNTVRDLLDDESQPANRFPAEDFVRGFKNQLEAQGISPLQAEAYGKAAEQLAANAVRRGKVALWVDAGARSFVRHFGLRAFRRPLAEAEVERYANLWLNEERRADASRTGVRVVLEAMLQSPHFLFRVARPHDDSQGQFAVANRLSYFLWNTMPDDDLLALAARGELGTHAQIEATARQMLDDSRSRPAMEEFLAQWLRFDQVLTATRDRRRYGSFNPELAAAMVEETTRLFSHLVWNDLNFMEFYTADYTFVNEALAELYDMPAPDEEFARVAYPANSGRGGVLGHATFHVATSKPSETSPTSRGLFVRNHFLSHEVPPPPPGLNTMLPEITEDRPLTNRGRLDVHLNSEACAGCHRLIDPIGFGFEQYDPIGGFRERLSLRFGGGRYDGGSRKASTFDLELNTTAYIQGIDNSTFASPKELGRILANNEACQRCIVKQLFRYAFGREERPGDQPVIEAAFTRFRDSGFRFRELIVALVTSKLFLQG